jgi:hypothetical protein
VPTKFATIPSYFTSITTAPQLPTRPWWDESGEFTLLHTMNPQRIHFVREKILEVLQTQPDATTTANANTTSSDPTQSLESPRMIEGMDVLDVGCGGGILSEVRPSFYPLGLLTDIIPVPLTPLTL